MKKLIILLSIFSFNCFSQTKYVEEKRDKIVVIDSGVSFEQSKQPYMCHNGVVTTYNDDGLDDQRHGTNIVSIVSPNIDAKTTCLVSIKVIRPSVIQESNISNYIAGLKWASMIKPKFVNISMVGYEPLDAELYYIMNILKNGGVVSVASGNEFKDLNRNCFVFPACFGNTLNKKYQNKFFVVGSRTTNSNYNGPVNVYLDGKKQGSPMMSGSSQATAKMTALLISK